MFANRQPYQTDSEVEIVEHPNSVELFCKAEDGHRRAMSLIQSIYEEIDEKTPQGKEWIEELQEVQKALQSGYEAVIQFKRQNDVMHTTILKLNRDMPGLIKRIEKLESDHSRKVASAKKQGYSSGRLDEAARRAFAGRSK